MKHLFFCFSLIYPVSAVAQQDADAKTRNLAQQVYDLIGVIASGQDSRALDTLPAQYKRYRPATEEEMLNARRSVDSLSASVDCTFRYTEEGKYRLSHSHVFPTDRSVSLRGHALVWLQPDGAPLVDTLVSKWSPQRSVSTSVVNLQMVEKHQWLGRFSDGLASVPNAAVRATPRADRITKNTSVTAEDVGQLFTIDTFELQLNAFADHYALFRVLGDHDASNLIITSEDEAGRQYQLDEPNTEKFVMRRQTYSVQLPASIIDPLLAAPLSFEDYFEAITPVLNNRRNLKERPSSPYYLFVRFIGPVSTLKLVEYELKQYPPLLTPCSPKMVSPEELMPKKRNSPFLMDRN